MDAIKKMVEEISYFTASHESEEQKEEKYGHIETDEEIDGSLRSILKRCWQRIRTDRSVLYVPRIPMVEDRLPVR